MDLLSRIEAGFAVEAQELFDYAISYITAQGKPSISTDSDGEVFCRYRDDAGGACAVGCLIPDSLYRADMESILTGTSVVSIYKQGLLPSALHDHLDLLTDMQLAHDDAAQNARPSRPFLQSYRRNMSTVARVHSLNTTAIRSTAA